MKTIINGNNIRLNEPYQTRDGRVAIITEVIKSDDYPLKGNIDGSRYSWTNDGLIHAYSKSITGLDIINLDKYNGIEEIKTRPHKHADLIAKLAEKLKTDHEAWKKVQFQSGGWYCVRYFPVFDENKEYRFEPETVMINGVECPKAVSEKLLKGDHYYFVDTGRIDFHDSCDWEDDLYDSFRLSHGIIYLNSEDAITVAKALLKPLTEAK